MSELELGVETPPASIDEPIEDKPTTGGKVKMINNRKNGRVFPRADVGYGPGETFTCTEKLAKHFDQVGRVDRVK